MKVTFIHSIKNELAPFIEKDVVKLEKRNGMFYCVKKDGGATGYSRLFNLESVELEN